MTRQYRRSLIVFCSPAGTTGHVARVIRERITAIGDSATLCDLGRVPIALSVLTQLETTKESPCLYISSPVYAGHAVPPVMSFIHRLPSVENGCAVPFVTWGGVSSGVALETMGSALCQKGYSILGAAKVVASHSLFWVYDEAPGRGHPDRNDDRMIAAIVDQVTGRLDSGDTGGIDISTLAYQPSALRQEMASMSLEKAKSHFPVRKVFESRCTECGICADLCPVNAISLSPFPRFGQSCIQCCNCVRLCPEGAIGLDLFPLVERIRKRAGQLNEQPLTQTFV